LLVLLAGSGISAADRQSSLQLEPEGTTIHFTLGSVPHTAHGTFRLKHGALRLDPASGRLTGEIVGNGESGRGTRNRKIQREGLESDRYPDIIFRPDGVEGAVAAEGQSFVQVHGIFSIHGTDHELTVPAKVESGRRAGVRPFTCDSACEGGAEESQHIVSSMVSESVEIDSGIGGVVTR